MSSVESTIYSVIATAKSLASQTVSDANSLIAAAAGVLNGFQPDYPDTFPHIPQEVGVSAPQGGGDVEKTVPTFPTIRQPKTLTAPHLGEIDDIEGDFTVTPPALTLPSFRYAKPSGLAAFAETMPALDLDVVIPLPPSYTWPDRPALGAINTDVAIETITLPPLDIEMPVYQRATLDPWRAGFKDGQALLPGLDQYAIGLLDTLCPGYQHTYGLLRNRIDGALSRTESALGPHFEDAIFQQARRKAEQARAIAVRQLDAATNASGWELPGTTRMAGLTQLETEFANALSAAALDAYTKRSERELQHLQFSMDTAAKLYGLALELFRFSVGQQLDAFKATIAFADSASSYAIKAYELAQQDFAIQAQVVELQIRLFESLLKRELAKLEITSNRLAIEKLKSDINQQLIQQYTAEISANETRARTYAAQITALKEEIGLRKVPLEIFGEKVKLHTVLADAKKAEYAVLEAEIAGDKAAMEGELAKVKLYETQANVFRTVIDAKSTKTNAQIKRNELLLDEYKSQVQNELALVQIDEAIAKHALNAYEAMAKIYLADRQADLENARFRFDKILESAKLALEKVRFEFEGNFKNIELELGRVKALADVQMSGAQVSGHLAGSALSALNSVVAAEVRSEA